MKEIMIIEDTKFHQQKIKDAVSELGYKVAAVFSYGEKAVDYILKEKNQPDLIIIDIVLEGKIDGYQVAKKISSERNIPFIFLSVKKDKIKDFEASVYLNKPFNKQELKNNIELALYKYDIYQKMLKSNEEKEMILDTTETQIWYLKDPVTYGKVNQAHADFIGLDKSEIENKKTTEFLPEKEAETCNLGNKKVFNKRKKIETEEWLVNANGEKRLLSITKNPKLNQKKEVEYVVCSAKDVTENKEIEKIIKDLHKIAVEFKELENEKEICKMTVKAAEELLNFNLCNVLLVKEGKFVPMASSSDFKQEKRSISDKSIAAKTYNEGKNFIINDLQDNPEAASVENVCRSAISIPVGDYGVFQAAAPNKNSFTKNDLEMAEILISHATAGLDRVYAQQKIKEQKNFLSTILEVQSGLVLLLNSDGEIVRFNNTCEKLTGYKEKEVKGKIIWELFIKKNEEKEVRNIFNQLRGKDYPNKHENYWLTKTGEERLISWSNNVILDSNNNIKYVVATGIDITERKKREEKIEYLSFHDKMTGLYNRRYFENELKRLDSSRKYPITIVIGDLDGLKDVNDNYGHKKGDQYIINAADILKTTARTEDIVARIGGDEFAVVLPATNQKEAKIFCQRISKNIENFNKDRDNVKPLSISLGFEVMEDSSQSLNKVFNKADQKMYINKGRK